VIYLIGVIQRVRAGALDIVKESVGNFGDAETQCGRGERQDNNRDRQPSRQPLLMKDVAFSATNVVAATTMPSKR
jgi:hypothetical protein